MSQDPKIFPIFHLARELRDLIYFHLLDPVQKWSLANGFKLNATHLPRRELLLLSHQFTDEYLSIASKLTTLTIHDHCLGGSGYQLPSLPKEVLAIENVKFNVACTAWRDAAGEVEFHDGWIKGMLGQMRERGGGGKVAIHMHFGSGISAAEYEAALTWSGCWTTEMEGLDELLLFRVGSGCTAWAFDAPKTLLIRWSKEKKGFERMVEDVDGEQERGNVWLNTQLRM
ncbi:hypothetical protein PRZ48_009244 [Zasmidium cellare]|uniref:Uncharacterized protein n=1 Tax=Zasmidium cellare TaxID=395010 RepID=A0ABR0EBK0_ZASCE|nr:hypothetical protein PRZ48_009244 [Zasmidium cellare]